ncbi:MAG: NTP transferase domain-containing protein, partial [Gemmatimonadetes bacterium]|nr:NTP transferase domain-containing protein [Gemmatimonadota bacterium]NIQ56879.1 NTP transferase domain-containing protein [Gemmatimonadota bacterium]NIU77058.1 NTP transferase domain-containing protein [Gammaproteobacteria bacterium]NIX46401.1 NTP transferase domain-containing protein [Gemmatimonadota bacterium]NIY10709.1 NTP transferase domain-containing protein [Gemmatimonadota bacterium]
LRTLVAAFDPGEGRGICVPVVEGTRGNPVLWGARYFEELQRLEGDVGGRPLLVEHAGDVHEVGVAGDGVLRDIDTPEALEASHAEEE